MRKFIRIALVLIFVLDILPFFFIFSMEKGNFISGTFLLFFYIFLWIIKIILSIRLFTKPTMDKCNTVLGLIILIIFIYIQCLNYQFIYCIT